MKWRKLASLPGNSRRSPDRVTRFDQRRAAGFEVLEARKLMAADLVEVGEKIDTETAYDEPIELRTLVVDDGSAEIRTFGEPAEIFATGVIDQRLNETDGDDPVMYTLGSEEMSAWSWNNTSLPEDVNGDSNITALDMLLVINALNQFGAVPTSELQQLSAGESSSQRVHCDINGDSFVTPLDALLLANYFNAGGGTATDTSESQDAGSASLWAPDLGRVQNPDEWVDGPFDSIEGLTELANDDSLAGDASEAKVDSGRRIAPDEVGDAFADDSAEDRATASDQALVGLDLQVDADFLLDHTSVV